MRWIQCSIKKWSCVNFQFQFHERIHLYTWHMSHAIYKFLLLALTWDLITPNRQSILRDTRTAFSLPPVIVNLRIEHWCFIFRCTCSPNVNTKQMLGQVWQCHVYVANNFRKQQWSPQWIAMSSASLGLYSLSGKTSYRKISWSLEAANRSEIWQVPRQRCCRGACQISERYDHCNIQSRGFETSRDLTVRRLTA